MTPTELRAILATLGLTQGRTARLLGVNLRTVERWATGASDIPRHVALLLALMADKDVRDFVEKMSTDTNNR